MANAIVDGADGVAGPEQAVEAAVQESALQYDEALWKRIFESIRKSLPKALRTFKGQMLAEFSWKTKDASNTTKVTLTEFKEISRSETSSLSFTLSWSAGGGKPVDMPVSVSVQQSKGTLSLNVTLFASTKKTRNWTLVKEDRLALAWETGEAIKSLYPPQATMGIQRLGKTWFSESEPGTHEVGIKKAKQSLPCTECIRAFWPLYGDKSRRWSVELPRIKGEERVVDWGACVLSFAVWAAAVILFQEGTEGGELDPRSYGLPLQSDYWPKRSVDLNPNDVRRELKKMGLHLPWHLIEAACSSLNARKNIIFSGPPGCGKSKLAITLAKLAMGVDPLVVTASAAWTSGDLIGRYMPRRDGKELQFRPGFFLRALESNRWLVIDEFNRADIDQCFGELFSVLAGDAVELPFEVRTDDETDRTATVRIVPVGKDVDTEDDTAEQSFRDYKMGPEFRMIGTMNDADRSRLHQLSFALQRRFDILRVEAPSAEAVQAIIQAQLEEADKDESHLYGFKKRKGGYKKTLNLASLQDEYLLPLFASTNTRGGKRDVRFTDLVAERVIGVATVQDVIRFVAEGMRCPYDAEKNILVELEGDNDHKLLPASYLAMALVLSVFPQLDTLPVDRLKLAVKHILGVFRDDDSGVPFMRIDAVDVEEKDPFKFKLVRVRATGGSLMDLDGDEKGEISIPEYLVGELCLQYRGTDHEEWLKALIERKSPASKQ